MKIKFSTILIIAAVAAAIWYFTKPEPKTENNNGYAGDPVPAPVSPIMQQPVIKPALKKPVIKPVVRPATISQVPVLQEIRQRFFGRA